MSSLKYKLFLFEQKVKHHLSRKTTRSNHPKPSRSVLKSITKLFLVIFLILTTQAGILLFIRPKSASAWYNDAFQYRQLITFTHNAALSNQSMRLTISNTNTLVTSGKMQSDCDDTRFTDSTGSALRLRLISGCNSASTVYDVIFPTVLNGTNFAYIYYGNPSAISVSDNTVPTGTSPSGTPSFASEEVGATPTLYWSLDDTNEYTVQDTTANNNDGTLGGSATTRTIEQSITLINQEYTTASLTAAPTNNSNGIIQWDASAYSNETVYFEAIIKNTNGSYTTTAELYTSGGSLVTSSGVSTSSTTYTRVRSAAITLSDATEYTIRLRTSNASGTAGVFAARLIIVQSASSITDTVSSPELTGGAAGNGTTYTPLSPRRLFYYDAAAYSPSPTVYLEAALQNLNSSGTTYLALYENGASCTTQVTGSEISQVNSGSTPFVRKRSGALTLTSGTTYMLCVKTSNIIHFGVIPNARLILSQTDSSGISATQIYHTQTNTPISDGATTYTDTYSNIEFNPSNFQGGTFAYYFESTFKTDNAATAAYVQLYNKSDSSAITGSELTTTSTSYTRVRSGDITSNMPSSAKTLDTQYRIANGGDIVNVNGSYLIINATNLNANQGGGATTPTRMIGADCAIDGCLYFDGTDDKASRSYSSDIELDPGTNSFTISTWFRHPSTISGTDVLLARSNNAVDGTGYKVYMNSSGYICFGIDEDGTSFPADNACSTTSFADSKWHHLTAVKNTTSNIQLYLNGKLTTQTNITSGGDGSLSGSSPTLYVGIDGDGTSNPWVGFIDEIKVYNYAKSSAQVITDYSSRGTSDAVNTAFGNTAPTNSISNGLVGYYSMDENTGTTISDTSGNNGSGSFYEGTTAGSSGPTWTGGKFGSGASFGGTNDVIRIPETTPTDLGATTDSYTVSTWFKTSTSFGGAAILVAKTAVVSSAASPFILQFNSGNTLSFSIKDGFVTPTITTTNTYNDGIWHMATATRNATSKKISFYIDGILINTTTDTTTSTLNNNYDISIGAADVNYNNYDFTGQIDEVRMYNRALSSSEVSQLYNWAPGPIAYWNMDEGSGTNIYDSSGNGNTGTFASGSNAPSWDQGKYGKGTRYNETANDYITVPDADSFDIAGGVTVSMWMYLTNTADNQLLFGRLNDSANNTYRLNTIGSQGIEFALINSTGTGNAASISPWTSNSWVYMTGTWDGTTVKIYENGILKDSVALSGTLAANTDDLLIGGVTNAYFGGKLDDVKVYNYARTPSQIIQDMNAGHPVVGTPVAGPVAHWSMDEGYGTTANDQTPNDNDLTLNTASWTNDGKFGKAWDGVGTNWLSRADDADFDFAGSDEFTISQWIKSDSATNPASAEMTIAKFETSGGATRGYAMSLNTNGTISFIIDDDNDGSLETFTTSQDYYDGLWHHVVIVKKGTSFLNVYVDSIMVVNDTSISDTGSLANNGALVLGDNNGANSLYEFTGNIDEVKIYRVALTQSDILTEYTQGKALVLGSLATTADGKTATNSASREYCVPGDTGTCSAPVLEWNFNENTGTTANDTSTNGYTGTLTNGPRWVPAKNGSGVNLDGANDYVTTSTSVFNPTAAYTVSMWAYLNTTNTDDSFFSSQSSDASGLSLYIGNGTNNNLIYCNDGGCTNTGASNNNVLQDRAWHHVTLTYDGSGTAVIYVNGQNVTSDGAVAESSDTGNKIIGNFDTTTNNALDGKIDEVKIYNYARTPAQVAWEYNKGKPVGHWQFDECAGSTVYDASENNSHGTIYVAGTGTFTTTGTCASGSASELWNSGTQGKYSSALSLDGGEAAPNETHIRLPDNIWDNLTQGTIAFWMKPNDSGDASQIIFGAAEDDNNAGSDYFNISYRPATDDIYVEIRDNAAAILAFDSAAIPNPTQWHHILVSNTTSGTRLYIDGTLQTVNYTTGSSSTDAWIDNVSENTTAYTIGCDTADGSSVGNCFADGLFEGLLDDFRVYNYALTNIQVKTLLNENAAVRFAPLTGTP